MSREAIEKTIREIRDLVGKYGVKSFGPIIYTRGDLADRIEADVADILAENARLKAALKPVLEVGWVEKRYNYCSGTVPTKDPYFVVREAQGIYNGGAK